MDMPRAIASEKSVSNHVITVANRVTKPALRIIRKNSKAFAIAVFLMASIVASAAHFTDRTITAALVYLIGVMVIGALRGLRGGFTAALAASVIYSGLIRNPGLQINDISLEYYVPLFGFNFAALLSGMLADRLKDRAEYAEQARRKLDMLLAFSSRLQHTVRIEDVAHALRVTASPTLITQHVRPYVDHTVEHPARAAVQKVIDLAIQDEGSLDDGQQLLVEDVDIPAFVDLLSMAVDRCGLLEDRAETQARKQSENFKTTILSSLSHDLRTPIAAIAASATSLKQYGDSFSPDTRAEMLEVIEHQCARLDQFTAKLLSFGRLQGGVAALQFEPSDVIELLGKAIASVRATGPDHRISKEWADGSIIVMANPAMLEQVFFNILENAFSYTPPGSNIYVIVRASDAGADIVIRDNGRGVSPESIGRIFEPFFRSGQSKHTNGQGLGLFIAKGFVEAFGGTISCRSPHDAGPGLEIAITIPLAGQVLESNVDG